MDKDKQADEEKRQKGALSLIMSAGKGDSRSMARNATSRVLPVAPSGTSLSQVPFLAVPHLVHGFQKSPPNLKSNISATKWSKRFCLIGRQLAVRGPATS
jgi:hypothetical protein